MDNNLRFPVGTFVLGEFWNGNIYIWKKIKIIGHYGNLMEVQDENGNKQACTYKGLIKIYS